MTLMLFTVVIEVQINWCRYGCMYVTHIAKCYSSPNDSWMCLSLKTETIVVNLNMRFERIIM